MKEDASKATKPSTPAASHMLWFFLLPAFLFLGWATYQIVTGINNKKEEPSLIQKARAIEKGRSDGDRWKAAYAFAEELLKKSREGKFATMPKAEQGEILAALSALLVQFKEDVRLKKYLILTLGRLHDASSLPLLREALVEDDKDLRFYAAWGYLETLNNNKEAVEKRDIVEVSKWLNSEDAAFRKIAATFLVQQDKTSISRVKALLKDSDKEVRWNTAVALASIGDGSGNKVLMEVFDIKELRSFGFRSAKDLEQLLRAAKVAALKLDDPEVLSSMSELKDNAEAGTPEGRAILSALENP